MDQGWQRAELMRRCGGGCICVLYKRLVARRTIL